MSQEIPDLASPAFVNDAADAGKSLDLSLLRALIFQKETETLKGLISVLRWCGLRNMTVVVDLKKAVEHLVSKKFDLIFVTHLGEGKEATQLIEELKGLDATSDIPLIAITTDGDIKKVLRILAKGVDEVIVTPLSRETVENVALRVLQNRLGNDPIKNRLDSARELRMAEQFEAAQSVYLELLSQDSSLLDAHLGLCEVNCRMQQWEDAEIHLRKALDAAKSADNKVESHLQLAQVFFHYGNYHYKRDLLEKAIKCYQTSLSLNPFHTESVKALLELLQKRDEPDEIIKVVRDVCANFLPYSRATEEIAICLWNIAQRFVNLDMPVEAKHIYEQLLQFPHGNVDVHLKVADFFLEAGQVSQVLERLVNLLQKLKDSDILFKTGSIFLDIEKRYLSSGKANTKSKVDLAFLQDLDSGKAIAMAEKMFKQGLILDPENPRFSLNLARCYIRQAEAGAAAEALAKLKERYAEDAQSMEEVIDVLLVENAYDHAIGWIRDAINRFPQEISLYMLYARYYNEQKKPYDAIGCIKRALTINPSHAQCMILLAELYETIKEYSDAILYYEKAINLLPNDLSLQERLTRVLKLKYKK